MDNFLKSIAEKVINKSGYKIIPAKDINSGYISASETVAAARKNNMSVSEYVEMVWDQKGCTENVIKQMEKNGCFSKIANVLEIGPGTGRYLDLIIKRFDPAQYDIYEIAKDWKEYLVREYHPHIKAQPADGKSLKYTPDNAFNIVHAHGVFVYLQYLQAFEYFSEMCRVCAPYGYIIFDFYSENEFDTNQIKKWLATQDRYAVVLNYSTVIDFFQQNGFELIDEFLNRHGHGFSRYLILKNTMNI